MKKFLAILCIALAAPAWAQTPAKYALVIGNAAYTVKPWNSLPNPVNDAGDIAAAMRKLGFEVDLVRNGNLARMQNAVITLKQKLRSSPRAYGFFYYAGHGAQNSRDSGNYLIPVDADTPSLNLLPQRALPVQFVLDELEEAGNMLNMVVLDACRDVPELTRGAPRGLSVLGNIPRGSIVMYATAANKTASDGEGGNGLFTSHLLRNLATPGLSVNEIFIRTGADVSRATNGDQYPEMRLMFFETAYLSAPPAPVTPTPAPTVQPAPRPAPAPANRPTMQSAPAQAPANRPSMQAAPTVQPAARIERPVPGGFVRVEGGTFQMGSNDGDSDEKPVHSVTVKSFSIGKYEVTQKEWVEVMGYNPSAFKGDNLPVEQVTWNDAVEYCNRRSRKEGLTPAYTVSGYSFTWNRNATGYRLPTEAEWEFAARGGIKGGAEYAYSGSNNALAVAWHDGNSGSTTHDVGTKAPNSLGIYDMTGNVYEWCWDRYGKYSSRAQTDPTGASSGSNRVQRGGSWNTAGWYVRSALRSYSAPAVRVSTYGFRLVRP